MSDNENRKNNADEDCADTKERAFPLKRCIAYLLLLTTLLSGVTFSRYLTSISENGVGAGSVSNPIVVADGDLAFSGSQILELDKFYPGKAAKSYTFSATNDDGSKVSSVAISYSLTIKTTNNLPLRLTLSCPNASPSNVVITGNGNGGAIQRTVSGDFEASVSQTDTYTLTVEWPGSNPSSLYAEEIDLITTEFTWHQTN